MIVLLLSVALLAFLGVLFTRTVSQRGTHSTLEDQAKALLGAKALLQAAIYKYRVLPSDFFRIKEEEGDPIKQNTLYQAWVADFDASYASSPARAIQDSVPGITDIGLATWPSIVNFSKPGMQYKQDFMRVRTYAVYNGFRKEIEELVELHVTQ